MTRAFAALLLVAAVEAFARPKVLVVKSADLAPYALATAGFTAEVKGDVTEVLLEEGADAQKTLKKQEGVSLVLAVGPAAAVNARKAFADVPVVFVMVPYFQKYDLEGANTTGVALTSDLSFELTAARALLPQAKRLGVVMDPRLSRTFFDEASQLAQARGLSLVALELENAGKIDALFDKVLSGGKGRLDGFVVISDKTVSNAAVVERLLAFAKEERLPVIGLAPTQVKQGALFALSPAPLSIGLQAGRLANRVLLEKVDPGALAVATPDGVELHVNLSAAKRLGLPETFATELLTFAARQGLTVRAIE